MKLKQPVGKLPFNGMEPGKLLSRFFQLFLQNLFHDGGIPVLKKGLDFVQRHIQGAQIFNGIHPLKLSGGIIPVPGPFIHNLRLQQADFIIIAQRPDIDTEQPAHFPYGKEVPYIHFITSTHIVSNTPHKTMTNIGFIFFFRRRTTAMTNQITARTDTLPAANFTAPLRNTAEIRMVSPALAIMATTAGRREPRIPCSMLIFRYFI